LKGDDSEPTRFEKELQLLAGLSLPSIRANTTLTSLTFWADAVALAVSCPKRRASVGRQRT